MKTPASRVESFFKKEMKEQPIRLIKAAQAGKLLHTGHANGHGAQNGAADIHKKPEIRLVQAGADFCDLEVICGCGESTRVRCWNAPGAEEKGAI